MSAPHPLSLSVEGLFKIPGKLAEGESLRVRQYHDTDWLVITGLPTDSDGHPIPAHANWLGESVAGYWQQSAARPTPRQRRTAPRADWNRRLAFQTPATATHAAIKVMTSLGVEADILASELDLVRAYQSTNNRAVLRDSHMSQAMRSAHHNRANAHAWQRRLLAHHFAELSTGTERDGRGSRKFNPMASRARALGAMELIDDLNRISRLSQIKGQGRIAKSEAIMAAIDADIELFLDCTQREFTPDRSKLANAIKARNPAKPLCFAWWHLDHLRAQGHAGDLLATRPWHEQAHFAVFFEQQLQSLDLWLSLMRDHDEVYEGTSVGDLQALFAHDDVYSQHQHSLAEAVLEWCRYAKETPDQRKTGILEARYLIRHRVWPRLGGSKKQPLPWAAAFAPPGVNRALALAAA